MKQDKVPFKVWTEEIVRTGRPPFTVWGKTERGVAYNFFRKYGISPVKVTPAYWDIETGKYLSCEEIK